ncbi:hypothetical protein KIL84_019955 [Mauremys mutica]|uniref:Uncharacterized protein n=1 Tax=Mauremys mutica TaxID=74926 RepID=A0A9D3XXE4_9SAUR|nr:hypothetical protein KIL84_019955 [Mauremys mutica]
MLRPGRVPTFLPLVNWGFHIVSDAWILSDFRPCASPSPAVGEAGLSPAAQATTPHSPSQPKLAFFVNQGALPHQGPFGSWPLLRLRTRRPISANCQVCEAESAAATWPLRRMLE